MASSDEGAAPFASVAWVLKGLFGSSAPCLLRLAAGRLALVCREGPVFDAPLAEVEAVFPRYYFSGGAKLRVRGRTFRLSFVKPNSKARPADAILDELVPLSGIWSFAGVAGALGEVVGTVDDLRSGRAAGKELKRRLG